MRLVVYLFFISVTVSGSTKPYDSEQSKIFLLSCAPLAATCYGNTPCNACKTCNYCAHCTSGGTCGICATLKQKRPVKTPQPVTMQCKAITKNGTRCKRVAGPNGYCWQHG